MTDRATIKGLHKKNRASYANALFVASSIVLVSMSLWQSGYYIRKCTPAPEDPRSSFFGDPSITNSITPQLAILLHPLYNVIFQGHAFFVTGHDADDYMSKVHMSKGRFYETSVTAGVLRYQKLFGGDILDIGMNIGSISIPAAYFCQDCKVIGIEAIPSNFQKAVANGKLNGLSNLQQINVALQDQQNVTSLMFETTPGNMGMSNMAGTKWSQTSNAEVGRVLVAATTLDKLRTQFTNVRVAKVDIEGAELIAMKGGLAWLEENPPCVIIMEVDKIDLNAMTSLLGGKGFTIHNAGKEGIHTATANAVFKNNNKEKCGNFVSGEDA